MSWIPTRHGATVLAVVKADPPGGLRPDLTPAAGAAVQQQSGTGRFKIKSHQLKSLRFQGIDGLRSSTGRHVRRAVKVTGRPPLRACSGELGELCPAKRRLEKRPPERIAHHPLQRPVLIDL